MMGNAAETLTDTETAGNPLLCHLCMSTVYCVLLTSSGKDCNSTREFICDILDVAMFRSQEPKRDNGS